MFFWKCLKVLKQEIFSWLKREAYSAELIEENYFHTSVSNFFSFNFAVTTLMERLGFFLTPVPKEERKYEFRNEIELQFSDGIGNSTQDGNAFTIGANANCTCPYVESSIYCSLAPKVNNICILLWEKYEKSRQRQCRQQRRCTFNPQKTHIIESRRCCCESSFRVLLLFVF